MDSTLTGGRKRGLVVGHFSRGRRGRGAIGRTSVLLDGRVGSVFSLAPHLAPHLMAVLVLGKSGDREKERKVQGYRSHLHNNITIIMYTILYSHILENDSGGQKNKKTCNSQSLPNHFRINQYQYFQ